MNGATFRNSCAIFLTGWLGFPLWQDHREKSESHCFEDLCEEAARVKNLPTLCSGSWIDKVAHFSLSNKDIMVSSEKCFVFLFFSFKMLPSSLSFHLKMFNDWESCYMSQKLKQASSHSMCVYKPHVFISVGKLSWGCAPVKMFGLNLLSQNGQLKVFWSHPDQGLHGIIRFSRPECDFGFQRLWS